MVLNKNYINLNYPFLTYNQKAKNKRDYLSFVDATNIAICRENGITNIIAVDGDFDSYLNRL